MQGGILGKKERKRQERGKRRKEGIRLYKEVKSTILIPFQIKHKADVEL